MDLRDVVVRDVQAIASCDALYMLDDWFSSKGASAEFHIARWLGLHLLFPWSPELNGRTTPTDIVATGQQQ